jgi:hypothetical protein
MYIIKTTLKKSLYNTCLHIINSLQITMLSPLNSNICKENNQNNQKIIAPNNYLNSGGNF